MRIVEQDRAGPWRNGRLEDISIEPPVGRLQGNLDRGCSRTADHRGVAVIGGGEDDHFIAGLHGGENGCAQSLGCPAGDADMLGGKILAEVSAVMGCDRIPECGKAARRRILVGALGQRLRRTGQNFIGPSEIGEALPQIHRAVLRRRERHPFEDAGVHPFVDRVHGPFA